MGGDPAVGGADSIGFTGCEVPCEGEIALRHSSQMAFGSQIKIDGVQKDLYLNRPALSYWNRSSWLKKPIRLPQKSGFQNPLLKSNCENALANPRKLLMQPFAGKWNHNSWGSPLVWTGLKYTGDGWPPWRATHPALIACFWQLGVVVYLRNDRDPAGLRGLPGALILAAGIRPVDQFGSRLPPSADVGP